MRYDAVPAGRPPARSRNGMVATPHGLASATGLDVLRDGGSAVDAAIAANAVLCVAYPHMAGLGGDGFWLIAPPEGEPVGINASGPAAAAATRSFYDDHDEIPERGPAAALTVPGAADGWRLAHESYGDLPWDRLFEDAVALARDGVPVTADLSRWIAADRDVLAADDRAAAQFLDAGTVPEPGSTLVQPDLADALDRLARGGAREGFYEGETARRLCSALGEASPLAPPDFRQYSAEWVEPLSVEYRGHTAHGLPPNTQGIGALQLLGLLDGFDVASWGDGTAEYYHHLVEATKVAFADRDAWVTDPEYVDPPTDRLLSRSYLDDRRALIDADDALDGLPDPGIEPEGVDPTSRTAGGDTCALSVVDESGTAVSLIQSVYYDFGSGVVAGDTGIVPQNRGSFFSLDPDDVNALAPGKRPFHTLIPAMLTRDGDVRLVYGTMGGEGQPQTHAATVTRVLDFGYDVQTALEAPRWLYGRTWGAESRSVSLEGRIPDGVVDELARRGQPVATARDWDDAMGHAQAIRVYPDGSLEGGADPRGDGSAIGY